MEIARRQYLPIGEVFHESAQLWVPPKAEDPLVVAERSLQRPGQLLDDAVVVGAYAVELMVAKARTVSEREYMGHVIAPTLMASAMLARQQREDVSGEGRMVAATPLPQIAALRKRHPRAEVLNGVNSSLFIARTAAVGKSRSLETDYAAQRKTLMKSAQGLMFAATGLLIYNEVDELRKIAEFLSRQKDVQKRVRVLENMATNRAIQTGHTIAALSDARSRTTRHIEATAPRNLRLAAEQARERVAEAFHPERRAA